MQKPEKESIPYKTYPSPPLEITTTKALLIATFTKGSENIIASGFEWKKTTDNTYTKIIAQVNNNGFSATVTGLEEDTEYNVKAFITDASNKTYYATEFNFFTKGTVVDIDNNVYLTLRYGEKVWMTENMRVTHWADGTPFEGRSGGKPNESDGPVYYYDTHHTTHLSEPNFGLLYNAAAVTWNNKQPIFFLPPIYQGVCPDGWHVATGEEWLKLMHLFTARYADSSVASKSSNWPEPFYKANNYSQFSVEPAGFYRWEIFSGYERDFCGLYESAVFWPGFPFVLSTAGGTVGLKGDEGLSVRCVKD